MSRRTARSSLALLVAGTAALAACGSGSHAPVTPVTPTPPPPVEIRPAVFMDTASGFSTSDVHDVDDDIVRFDTASDSLVWADGRLFPGFPVSGLSIGGFRVRFGTKNGQHVAYFTEASRPNICDLKVISGQLSISPTPVTVPGS